MNRYYPFKTMPKKSDTNQQAADLVAQITNMDLPTGVYEGLMERLAAKAGVPKKKNAAAVALGRLGGLKGGHARAAKLSPQQRKASAQKAARARWAAKAEAGDDVVIKDIVLPAKDGVDLLGRLPKRPKA